MGTQFDEYQWVDQGVLNDGRQAAQDAVQALENGEEPEAHPVAIADGRQPRLRVRAFHLALNGEVVIFREVLNSPQIGAPCRYVPVVRATGEVLHGVFKGPYGDEGPFVETAILR